MFKIVLNIEGVTAYHLKRISSRDSDSKISVERGWTNPKTRSQGWTNQPPPSVVQGEQAEGLARGRRDLWIYETTTG